MSRTDRDRSASRALDPVDALAELSFAVQGVLAAVAADAGLSLTQLRLLGILRDRNPAMLDLARHLGLEKSSVSGLVDRAERRGLVERTPSAHDGRGTQVGLTADGRRQAERLEADVAQRLSGLLTALPEGDRARFATLVARLLARPAQPPARATQRTSTP